MKIIILFFVLFIGTQLTLGQGKSYRNTSQKIQLLKKHSDKYSSPIIQEIFKTHKDNSNAELNSWLSSTSEKNLILDDYSTLIHELLHGIDFSGKYKEYLYLVNNGEKITVSETKTFKSNELNRVIRKGIQDSIFRYNLYVGGRKNFTPGLKQAGPGTQVSSIQDGIYGLLEEYNAYYYSSLVNFENRNYMIDKYKDWEDSEWENYRYILLSSLNPYYEFRYFIGQYLVYAKKEHPSVYAGLLANNQLRKAFTIIDEGFELLIEQIEEFVNEIPHEEDEYLLLAQLKWDSSEEDILAFARILEYDKIYYDDFTDNGSNSLKEMLKDKEVYQEIKRDYNDLRKEFRKISRYTKGIEFFVSEPVLQNKFLNGLLVKELLEELESFKL